MRQEMRIIVSCPDCYESRVPAIAVTIRRCLDDDTQWSYRFTCPECHRPATAATSIAGARDAIEVGAKIETWQLPKELDERHVGPPLTPADLEALRAALN